MNDAIIGGAIAAVIGAVCYAIVGLCQERRREKAQRLTIVDALLAEIKENLAICETFIGQETWWLAQYKLDAYHAYKGQIFFLPADVRTNLVSTALILETCNSVIQTAQLREGSGQYVDKTPIPPQEKLIEQLKSIHKELHVWRKEHTR